MFLNRPWRTRNAELFTRKQQRSVKFVLHRAWHLLCKCIVKRLLTAVLYLGLQAKENNIYTWHGLQPEACTSALVLRSPARELRPTLQCPGPTRQGDDTICPELEKTGPEVRPVRVEWFLPCAVLCVVSSAPVALLAHLVLDKPVRVCQRGTGLSAVKLGPLRCCKEARWCSTCLFTLGTGCL